MVRVKTNVARKKRIKRLLKRAKGNYAGRSNLIIRAKETVTRGDVFSYRGRKEKKRQFRRLWITRLGAACRMRGMSYSRFINGLSKTGIELDRKQLSELAISDPVAFDEIFAKVQAVGAAAGEETKAPAAAGAAAAGKG